MATETSFSASPSRSVPLDRLSPMCSWRWRVRQDNRVSTGIRSSRGLRRIPECPPIQQVRCGLPRSGYQWLADDTEIDGATSSTYTVQTSDNSKVIKVRVTFTDDEGGDESLTSAGTSAVVTGGI